MSDLTPVRRKRYWIQDFSFTINAEAGPACAVVRRIDDGSWVATVTALTPSAALRGAQAAARPDGATED